MRTIRLYFSDHVPMVVTGDAFQISIQLANAKLYQGFVAWEVL